MTSSSVLIIWLDACANDGASSFRGKLTRSHDLNVRLFTDSDLCVQFIRAQISRDIFLVSSGSLGRYVLPFVHDLEQVRQVYVFCGSISSHMGWAMDYIAKLLMFDHDDDMLQRLFSDIGDYLRERAERYLALANACTDRAQQLKPATCG